MPDACLRPDLTLPLLHNSIHWGWPFTPACQCKSFNLLWSAREKKKAKGTNENVALNPKDSAHPRILLICYMFTLGKYLRRNKKQPPEKAADCSLLERQCQQSGCGLDIPDQGGGGKLFHWLWPSTTNCNVSVGRRGLVVNLRWWTWLHPSYLFGLNIASDSCTNQVKGWSVIMLKDRAFFNPPPTPLPAHTHTRCSWLL